MSQIWKRVLPLMFAGVFALNAQEAASVAENESVKEKPAANATNGELKAKVEKALAAQNEWMIYQKGKGISRLKIFGQQNYYGPKENDIFKVVKVDDKYYAQLQSGTILEEHWENKDKFQNNFIPYTKFIAEMDKQIKTAEEKVEKGSKDYDKNEAEIDQLKKTSRGINDQLVTLNNRKQQKINDRKSYDYEQRQIDTLENQLKNIKRKIHDEEKDNKTLKKELKKLEQELEKQKTSRKKYPATPTA